MVLSLLQDAVCPVDELVVGARQQELLSPSSYKPHASKASLSVVCTNEALLLPYLVGYPTYLVTKILGFAALLSAQALLASVPMQYRRRGGAQVAHPGCGQLTQPEEQFSGCRCYQSCYIELAAGKALSGFTCSS